MAAEAAGAQPMPMSMPGMTMPMPAKPTAKKSAGEKARTKPAAKAPRKSSSPTRHGGATAMPMPMPGQTAPAGSTPMPMEHLPAGQPQMGGMAHGDHGMAMTGALGRYPMQRESSGTAWQPDTSEPTGLMTTSGDWTLMAHGVLNLVYDHQSGPRGDDKAFASGMLMGMANRPFGNGTLQFKAMVSPEPLMGPSGYPLLLASGETANGRDRLIDRQHPHDFFMELSGSVSQNIGAKSSLFLYAALPGEPAFGPPAFMHREAILDSPEAPISHHWLDSTHISFGVVTAGLVLDRVKLEISRFNGREPDQYRWNIETGPPDSTSIRVSWNPTSTLALQASWGHLVDPEQLEPGVDQKRLSASALYAREIAPGWKFAGTLAWGRKSAQGHNDDAYVAETSLKHAGWTVFGRGEITENRELVAAVENGPAYRVGKVSLGAVRDFRIADHLSIGAGGLFALNFVPGSLAPLYGGSNPTGTMAFIRLRLQ
ncbi:hypothetical protein [Sphingomonas sp.]|uniref:hypothetical protein n=1 Tax=Sphingomonas sp. TaxID=28214 RepID=UPI0038AA7392